MRVVVESGGKHTFLVADMFDKRPPIDEMLSLQDSIWEIEEGMKASFTRKVCPIEWFGIYIDTRCAFLLG